MVCGIRFKVQIYGHMVYGYDLTKPVDIICAAIKDHQPELQQAENSLKRYRPNNHGLDRHVALRNVWARTPSEKSERLAGVVTVA